MKTRAKFKCVSVEKPEGDNGVNATFEAVTGRSEENDSFFRWTPSGQLTLACVNDHGFVEGKEYYLDIILVEETG